VIYLVHIHRCYSFFKQLGINGPQPTFLLGNLADFVRTKRISISIQNWTTQFGRIYGYFEGHTPVLVVSDPDILHNIFIKNFSKFHSRRQFPLEDRRTTKGVHLFSATGDEWRRQRAIINPTFSSLKMKRMLPIIDDCISTLIKKLEESMKTSPQGFDIYRLYKCLTMDLIWRCCFGIKTDMQSDPNDPYLKRSQEVFARENSTFLATLLAIFIPELQPIWLASHCWMNNIKSRLRYLLPMGEKLINDDPSEWLKDNVDYFIKKAQIYQESHHDHNENIIKSTDLIHLMLDATEKNFTDINQVKIFILNNQKFLLYKIKKTFQNDYSIKTPTYSHINLMHF
jgi:cytochrome P450